MLPDATGDCGFLAIPPELREQIYGVLFDPSANRFDIGDEYIAYRYKPALAITQVNKQMRNEALKVFHKLNTFVRIEIPWPEAQNHVALEGHVPIIADGQRAVRFQDHRMTVTIDAPQVPIGIDDDQGFLVHLDDLEKFTTTWYYSDLSHPPLNSNLRLTLTLRDPFTPSWEEPHIPKPLQRRLLLPFSTVKGLQSTVITGTPRPLPSIETELRTAQAVPHPSPEACLSEGIRLKLEGNAALTSGNPLHALELYRRAFHAIHIVVRARQRHVHGDAFFNRELREAPFHNKNGQSERLILRVQLVANTCHAYLKLERYEDCAFWGMRSIGMLRAAMGADGRQEMPAEDEAVVGFPAADQMGKIYYRTAVAKKHLDDLSEARRLLRVASVYLPRDENVKKEVAACAGASG